MTGHFGEQRRGNGSWLTGFGEYDGGSARKKQAGDLVHCFVAHRSVNEKNAATGVIFLPKFQQFARSRGIVRAVEIKIGLGREPFQTSRPICAGDTLLDGGVGYGETAFREQTGGDCSSECIANLKTPGQGWSEDELFARMCECRDSAIQAVAIL